MTKEQEINLNPNPNDTDERVSDQIQIRLDKLKTLQDAGADPFLETTYEITEHAAEIVADFDRTAGKIVRVAGRIMSKRGMGKVSFCDLQDRSGKIQIFTRVNDIGAESYAKWQEFDIGDIVGVEGEVFRTKRGEVSIRNSKFTLLAKSLRPLPEKFHGLRDTDTRYRKRYLDLIVNPEVKETFEKRSLIIRAIRNELEDRNFLEVETPLLNLIPGGAAARPFITHHNTLDLDLYMRVSPELYLKRLIVGGLERVFEIGRNFRNEGMSVKHNPEFTMMEVYQAYTDYHGMMELSEALVVRACKAVNKGSTIINFQGVEIDLTPPFARITMSDAVREHSGLDFSVIEDAQQAKQLAREKGVEGIEEHMGVGDILELCFETFAEPKLIQPTFVLDYPIEISPLTKKKPGQPHLTERFELFIYGSEFGNAYSELNDPLDQEERFRAQMAKRQAGDDEAHLQDDDFVEALSHGMPPTGGLGIGIDRLVMLLTDNPSIRDVLLFPTMKPLGGQTADNQVSSFSEEDDKTYNRFSTDSQKSDLSKIKVEPLFADMVDFETFSQSDFRVVKVLNCEDVPKSDKLLKFILNDGSGTERINLSGIKEYYRAEDLIGKTLVAITNLPVRKMMGIPSQGMVISAVYEHDGKEGLDLLILDDNIPAGAKLY